MINWVIPWVSVRESSHMQFGTATVCFVSQQSHAVWYSYSLFCVTAVTCSLVQLQFVLWQHSHIQFGTATVCFVTAQSHAVWYSYSLFCVTAVTFSLVQLQFILWPKLLHCKGDVTSCMYMERYRNVAQYFEDYPPIGIPANFQKYPTYNCIHCSCYRHKQAQIAQTTRSFQFLLCKFKSTSGSYLEITTGPDSVWSDTPLVEPVCKVSRV